MLAGPGGVPTTWAREPTGANREGRAPMVQLVSHHGKPCVGEPSDARWTQKGTQVEIPLRNGWTTMVTVEGRDLICTITVANGSAVASFHMKIGNTA